MAKVHGFANCERCEFWKQLLREYIYSEERNSIASRTEETRSYGRTPLSMINVSHFHFAYAFQNFQRPKIFLIHFPCCERILSRLSCHWNQCCVIYSSYFFFVPLWIRGSRHWIQRLMLLIEYCDMDFILFYFCCHKVWNDERRKWKDRMKIW